MFFQLLSEMLAKLEKNASAAIRRAASIEVTALLSVRLAAVMSFWNVVVASRPSNPTRRPQNAEA